MHTIETRRLNELVTLYDLEPDLKDVYVEGQQDKDLLDAFLRTSGRADIHVYTIDDVDVSEDKVQEHGLGERSNRSRIIVLSYILNNADSISASVLCIADRDFEDFLPIVKPNKFLTLTDFNSLESYVLQENTICKFVSVALGHLPVDPDQLMPDLKLILKDLFYIRLANETLKWGMVWLNPRRYLIVSRDVVQFRITDFIQAYLQKNGKSRLSKKFTDLVSELQAIAVEDDRYVIRGHDLMDTLQYVATKLANKRKFGDNEFFAGSLLVSLEAADLQSYSLFVQLLAL